VTTFASGHRPFPGALRALFVGVAEPSGHGVSGYDKTPGSGLAAEPSVADGGPYRTVQVATVQRLDDAR